MSRIARELHDSTAQSLVAVGMNLSMVEKTAGDLPESTRRKLQDSIELTRQACKEVRTLSYLLHPPALEEGDLWSAVRWYTEGFMSRSGIRVDLTLPKAERAGRLPQEVETTLFRIVQESLANIHRHSGSRRARIQIARNRSRVTLVVRDRGRGLPAVSGRRTDGPALMGVGIAARARQAARRGDRDRLRGPGDGGEGDAAAVQRALRSWFPIPSSTSRLLPSVSQIVSVCRNAACAGRAWGATIL